MKILVVEDDIKIAKALTKGLTEEGYIVDTAYNGEEGYDFLSTMTYNIALVDWMMPLMNGIELTKKIRKEGINTPIIFLTAKGEMEDKIEGLTIGADDYVTKPFSFEELLARIKAVTKRPQEIQQQILSIDDLTLNTKTFKVERNSKEIELSRKEYALLEYLLINKDIVHTKEKIIEDVWNFDSDVLPNTVEVYIGYLRNKIDKPFPKSKKLIKTVRGFGYKIGE